jgi:hypothetical protein
MDWPNRALERVPPSVFRPRHCPRRGCPQHHLDSPRRFRYTNAGSYHRASDRRICPRFRCLTCRSRFGQSAFTVSYWLKRPELLVPIAAGLAACSAHRQLARSLGCAPSTVTRLAARLGRHALLLQASMLEHISVIDEAVVLDHLETFVVRQEEALGLATLVGQRSWFTYTVDPAPHRRGGRRTPAQKAKLRVAPVVTDPESMLHSSTRIFDLVAQRAPRGGRVVVVSDGHPDYGRALSMHPRRERIEHRVYPNPPRGPKGSSPSRQARIRDRQMRAVDALHSLMRHSWAHLKRETIAFGRRTNAMVERGFLLIVWRNLVKKVAERRPDPVTPAMEKGLTDARWGWERVLARRLFPRRVELPPGWDKVYRRAWITASIGPNTLHRARYAY